jgi:GWxTD domain-containing protein
MTEGLLIESAVRALLLALAAGAVVRVLRVTTAAGRHAVWTVVLAGMLMLPLWTLWGPKASLPLVPSRPLTAFTTARWTRPAVIAPVDTSSPRIASVAEIVVAEQTTPATRRENGRSAVMIIYIVGVVVLFGRLMLGTIRAQRLMRRAVRDGNRWTSDDCATPVTVGWLRPMMILPRGWQAWPDRLLEAVTIHEGEHARRHDPLIQWLALLNRAMFWFHPLAWWLERRLASLAEDACDAAVLSHGHQRADYCEYLLSLARSVTVAGARLHVVATPMAGPSLSHRVHRILNGASEPTLSPRRLACSLAACAVLAIVAAATVLSAAPSTPSPIARPSMAQSSIATGEPLPEYWLDEDEWHREVAPLMTPEELASYRQVRTSAEREAFVSQFWKRRDPTPETEVNEMRTEFERRIAYAKEHLANADSAAIPGYETDRGRWYVGFGSPDSLHASAGASEEWRYRSLPEFGSDVVIRFDPTSIGGCTYRGGRYRIVSPAPLKRFQPAAVDVTESKHAFAQTYPDRFVYLSFPIDTKAVAIRWGLRDQRGAESTFGETQGPLDYVQGAYGSEQDFARPRTSTPLLERLGGVRLFEAGSIACTEQLPADTYTLVIDTTLVSGQTHRHELTFVVE